MMPQSTDPSLPEEVLAAEPARAASWQAPVRLALARQGLAWAALQPAESLQVDARRAEPARVAAGQAAPFRAEPAQVASGQAVPRRVGVVGQAELVLAASGQVEPARVALAREEPPPVDPVIP
jgi:hypothetical protein